MWKTDWPILQDHYDAFWKKEGLIVSTWGGYFPVDRITCPLDDIATLEKIEPDNWEDFYTDPYLVAKHQRYALAHAVYPGDMIPFSYCDWGTVSLAPMLGATQHFSKDTIWYTHEDGALSCEHDRALTLEEDNSWYQTVQKLAYVGSKWAKGKYHCGMPAMCGGLDVLSELRGASQLCMDLVFEPDWVKKKVSEIDAASKKAYHRLYDIMKAEDGSIFHAFFMIWGRGKTGLIQCDFASLISPEMFSEFAVPSIKEACSYLDYSLYHVDGKDALRTVDILLTIDEIDCIEFTPGPTVLQGGDPCWYPLYRKIKDAGKCVQAVEMRAEEVIPLLDAVGPNGMYLMVNFRSEKEVYETMEAVERFR